jgi:anti-sigma-K factor RskA
MTCLHEIDIGAFVLGALEPEERERVRRHIADCPACAATLHELEGLPRWLAQVPPPAALPDNPVPSELAFRRLHRSVTETGAVAGTTAHGRRSGRRRFLAVAAAVVAIGAAGLTGVVVATSSGGPTTVSASAGAVHAKAALSPTGQGTSITLTMAGVSSGQRCKLVAEDRDGRWATASEWTVDYHGDVHITGRVPMNSDDIQQLVVRTLDGRTLVSMKI